MARKESRNASFEAECSSGSHKWQLVDQGFDSMSASSTRDAKILTKFHGTASP